MEDGFDIERYLIHSKKVDVSDIDFGQAAHHPLSADEIRCLTYMMDVENHTIVYLRGLLNTCAIEDPDLCAFLSCWVYEEHFHGRTIRQFVQAAGVPVSPQRFVEVQRRASFRERLEDVGAALLCKASRHFHAAYLTWGAINELTTYEGYNMLRRRTANPVLAEVLGRLMKDERRHFAFYYNSAKARLAPEPARRLVTFLLRRFWTPVGSGVKPDPEVGWTLRFTFGDAAGRETVAYIDRTIAKLPGLAWFNMVTHSLNRALAALPALPTGGVPQPLGAAHPQRP
jgi:hypothetical protein